MFLDNSACNLASAEPDEILRKMARSTLSATRLLPMIFITAQEIMVINRLVSDA